MMNPKDRKSNPSGAAGQKSPGPKNSRPRHTPTPHAVDDDDWSDSKGDDGYESSASSSATASAASDEEGEEDQEDVEDAQEAEDIDEDSEHRPARPYKRRAVTDEPDGKGFFASLGNGLRNAGATAQRYTRIGLARAELEKLRFELRSALATLGELALHCWRDAPDVGLTAKDPAVYDAVKRVKKIRHGIREKQARIAELKKDSAQAR